MKRKGFTLIETSLALAVTAMIIGSVTILHVFVMKGLGNSSARFSNYSQAQALLDAIDEVGSQAQSYALVGVSGGTYLKLVMPTTCTDNDNNGLYDRCVPNRLSKRGLEYYGQGKRIWFYLGDDAGNPSTGGRPSVAIVSDDSNPASGTTLSKFMKYTNGKNRFPNIESMTFGSNGTDSFTVSVTASSNTGELSERKLYATQENSLKDNYTITRTFFTARWRK